MSSSVTKKQSQRKDNCEMAKYLHMIKGLFNLKFLLTTLMITADFPFGTLVVVDLWLQLDFLFAKFCRICLILQLDFSWYYTDIFLLSL